MSKPATHGGPRPGAGRPRKGEQPRVTISFSVDRETARMLRELRNDKVPANEAVEDLIISLHKDYIPNCKTCGFYENNCPFIRGKFIPYPSRTCKDYTYRKLNDE